MSIIRATSQAVCSVLNSVTELGEAAQQTIRMGTTSIKHKAYSHSINSRESAIADCAAICDEIAKKLNADEGLKAQYERLEADWPK